MSRDFCVTEEFDRMIYFIFAVLVVGADQMVKTMIRNNLVPGDVINVYHDVLKITYVNNKGAAFGFLSGQNRVLLAVPLIIIAALFVFIFVNRKIHPLARYALTLIAAGGTGNLIDRILYGQVTDMLSLSFFPPVFNIADIAVTLGCILIIIYALFANQFNNARIVTEQKRSERRARRAKTKGKHSAGKKK